MTPRPPYVWDPDKDASNQVRHTLSFADFAGFDSEPSVVEDDRQEYGERRFVAFGPIDGVPHCIVYTRRGGTFGSLVSVAHVRRKCAAMPVSESDDVDLEWTEDVWARARPASEVHGASFAAGLVRPSGPTSSHSLSTVLGRQSALAGTTTDGLCNVARP